MSSLQRSRFNPHSLRAAHAQIRFNANSNQRAGGQPRRAPAAAAGRHTAMQPEYRRRTTTHFASTPSSSRRSAVPAAWMPPPNAAHAASALPRSHRPAAHRGRRAQASGRQRGNPGCTSVTSAWRPPRALLRRDLRRWDHARADSSAAEVGRGGCGPGQAALRSRKSIAGGPFTGGNRRKHREMQAVSAVDASRRTAVRGHAEPFAGTAGQFSRGLPLLPRRSSRQAPKPRRPSRRGFAFLPPV